MRERERETGKKGTRERKKRMKGIHLSGMKMSLVLLVVVLFFLFFLLFVLWFHYLHLMVIKNDTGTFILRDMNDKNTSLTKERERERERGSDAGACPVRFSDE